MTTRKWQTFVEIDVSICSLTYGTSPCTAVVGTAEQVAAGTATGTQRCWNTVGSCQDREHYAETFVTLRFCKDSGAQVESGIEAIPSLVDADLTPGRISLGEDLGARPSVTCTFRDHPYADTGAGFDKYLSTRSYDPYSQGTFWAKFAARHPNLRGKKLRLIQGYVGQSLAEMETRHFIIDSVDGPSLDGTFSIVAKDPLKSLDGERATAPLVNSGRIVSDLDSSTTSISLTPSGIGNAEYAASGYLNISGTEIVAFTRSGDALTITRGQKGTTAQSHKTGDRVQTCLVYSAQDPANIIKDLLVTYGGVASGYVPLSDWTTETAAYNGQVYTATIPEPTAVKTLVSEIIEQAGLAVWWDEIGEKVRLQVLRQIPTDALVFDETMYRENSLRITAQPDKRKSQVWTYFSQKNPLAGLDLDNLPGVAVEVDTDSEADYGSPLTKVITSRWIPSGGIAVAERLNVIQLGRYLSPPRLIEFDLVVAEGTTLPAAGGGYRVSAPMLQGADGSRVTVPFTVTRIKVKDGICSVTGEELNWTDLAPDSANRVIGIDFNNYNLNWRSMHDALYGAPTAGGTVTLQIAGNARIGSVSVGAYALDTGAWPSVAFNATRSNGSATLTGIANTSAFVAGQAVTGTGIQNNSRVVSKTSSTVTLNKFVTGNGVTTLTLWTTILKLVVDGKIIGAGGLGGGGIHADNANGRAGNPGGPALHVQAPITATGVGSINGGGGGGGGGAGDYAGWFGPFVDGSAGGGGAGDVPGAGGAPEGSGSSWGSSGSLTAGGAGGGTGFVGGAGGGPGLPGGNGQSNDNGNPGGTGGAAGYYIVGLSLVDYSSFAGVFRGNFA